jgi:hypothetical protein
MATDPKWIPRERKRDPSIIETHSIVSHRTARGVVVIEWGDMGGQFDPEDARAFAHRLLREADNAETDAFVYDVLKNKVKADPHVIGGFLTEFRTDRARREMAAGFRRASEGDEIPEDDRR